MCVYPSTWRKTPSHCAVRTARNNTYFSDSRYWDGRARLFAGSTEQISYVQRFLQMAAVRPGESVLDVGCGNGTISLPLAAQGHHIQAVDFSQGMLDCLTESAIARGLLDVVSPVQASWDDDWVEMDVVPCDVALASRSMASTDLARAITLLETFAKRRVCITVAKGRASLYDPTLFSEIGRFVPDHDDCETCLHILSDRGIHPQVQTFQNARAMSFSSEQEARSLIECTVAPLTEEERRKLPNYFTRHIRCVKTDDAPYWTCDYTVTVTWAFIAWDIVRS